MLWRRREYDEAIHSLVVQFDVLLLRCAGLSDFSVRTDHNSHTPIAGCAIGSD